MDEKLNEAVTEDNVVSPLTETAECAAEKAVPETQEIQAAVEVPNEEPVMPVEKTADSDGIASQLAAVQQNITVLTDLLQAMNKRFDERIARTDFEEKSRENMFNELQAYRNELAFSLIKPVLLEVAKVRDNILRDAARYEEKGTLPTLEDFRNYATMDLAVILEENDIELYHAEVGSSFDAKRQKAVKRIPTAEQELDRKVARSTSDGCLYKGKVLKAENVYVYAFEQGKDEENG